MKRYWHVVYRKDTGEIVLLCSGDKDHYLPNLMAPKLAEDVNFDLAEVTDSILSVFPNAAEIDYRNIPGTAEIKSMIASFKYDSEAQAFSAKP